MVGPLGNGFGNVGEIGGIGGTGGEGGAGFALQEPKCGGRPHHFPIDLGVTDHYCDDSMGISQSEKFLPTATCGLKICLQYGMFSNCLQKLE